MCLNAKCMRAPRPRPIVPKYARVQFPPRNSGLHTTGTGTATPTGTGAGTGEPTLEVGAAETRRDEERAMVAAADAVAAAAAALSAEGQSPQGVPMVVPRTYGTPPSGTSATSPGTPTPASATSILLSIETTSRRKFEPPSAQLDSHTSCASRLSSW